MTKIDIISGFLGAGKTTWIKKMLAEALGGEQVVLIENEFGEIGIDGGFMKDSGIQITEMNSGCICCSLVGDFSRSLHEVLEKFHPDRIMIEPSGVGKLSDVMKSVIDFEKEAEVVLNGLVTVVNAKKAKKQMKAFGEFFNNQIAYATTIILSRTQQMQEDALREVTDAIRAVNASAAIVTTPWDELDGRRILSVIEGADNLQTKTLAEAQHEADEKEHEKEHHHHHEDEKKEHEHHHDDDEGEEQHHHHHHADEIFTSWGKETPMKFDRAKLLETLQRFSEDDHILRAKGMVQGTDGRWIYFDMVPGSCELRDGSPDYTGRLCVIGTELDEEALLCAFGLV